MYCWRCSYGGVVLVAVVVATIPLWLLSLCLLSR